MASHEQFIASLQHLRIVTGFHFASATLFIYDYSLTFPREVSLVWSARLTLVNVLFILTRYIPFVDGGFLIYYHVQPRPKVEICDFSFNAALWLFLLGKALPAMILILRTWVVCHRDTRLSICLPIFFIACWVPMAVVIAIFLKSVKFVPLVSPVLFGCQVIQASRIIYIAWIMSLVFQAGIFFLMLIQGIRYYRAGSSEFLDVIFRDGLLYYLYLFVISFINIIAVATLPPSLQTFFVSTERVFHAIFGCRVVLDVRGQVSKRWTVIGANVAPSSPVVQRAVGKPSPTDDNSPVVVIDHQAGGFESRV